MSHSLKLNIRRWHQVCRNTVSKSRPVRNLITTWKVIKKYLDRDWTFNLFRIERKFLFSLWPNKKKSPVYDPLEIYNKCVMRWRVILESTRASWPATLRNFDRHFFLIAIDKKKMKFFSLEIKCKIHFLYVCWESSVWPWMSCVSFKLLD